MERSGRRLLVEEALAEANPEALFADGFDQALVGHVVNHHQPKVAVYDLDLCVLILTRGGMSEEDAREYLEFNVVGAYAGKHGPLFIWSIGGRQKIIEESP